MSWKKFITGIAVGFAAAYALEQWRKQTVIPSDQALQIAKEAFKKSGNISGSWIQTNVDSFEKDGLSYQVYRGGITKTNNSETEAHEFIMDAYTGTIIETRKL
ncbi:PepSY domain-containing protein [Thermolongibacillus altinsuensis]|jgi:predicted small secreted protein|uniref:PepSY domain-containing protein n=1 Tax=Thermolongibacillus altinsuensis TaxID=575256 RepID=UPI00242A2F97|nr:PepSY domain-containing protein [Thermolongibacillus altinsuensis]GMB07297.1 peptidase M4 [Thermolongibacillus altinsuensis]